MLFVIVNVICYCYCYFYQKIHTKVVVEGKEIPLQILDFTGREDFAKLRRLYYHKTNCFLLCVNVADPESFEIASNVLLPDMRETCPGVP